MPKLFRDNRLHRTYLAEAEEFMYVPSQIAESTAFIYGQLKGKSEKTIAGTAFFVSILDRAENLSWTYAVTARHLLHDIEQLCSDQKVHFRINRARKGYGWVETELGAWKFHPRNPLIDVAVLPWASPHEDFYTKHDDDFSIQFIPQEFFINDSAIKQYSIGTGDEISIIGLWNQHEGKARNIPIVRIGSIASMPSEPIAMEVGKAKGAVPAYLIEARSTGGLSGSPVFVNMGFVRRIGDRVLQARGNRQDARGVFVLLGLVQGHYDDPNKSLRSIVGMPVNMGIATVIPMNQIKEVLDQKELAMKRKQDVSEQKRQSSPILDSNLLARSVVEAAIGEPLTPLRKPKKTTGKAKKRERPRIIWPYNMR